MENINTPNLEALDADTLLPRAEAIRDAMQAKSVTAAEVGLLFVDLINATGNTNAALRLFLSSTVPDILADIDARLAGVDAAVAAADAELQRSEAARALVESLVARLSTQNLAAPSRVDIISAPRSVTISNPVKQQIRATLFPRFGLGSVLAVCSHPAIDAAPDGVITPLALGRAVVRLVATSDTSVYKSLCIDVVPPRIRLSSAGIRLDSKGNIRLT